MLRQLEGDERLALKLMLIDRGINDDNIIEEIIDEYNNSEKDFDTFLSDFMLKLFLEDPQEPDILLDDPSYNENIENIIDIRDKDQFDLINENEQLDAIGHYITHGNISMENIGDALNTLLVCKSDALAMAKSSALEALLELLRWHQCDGTAARL